MADAVRVPSRQNFMGRRAAPRPTVPRTTASVDTPEVGLVARNRSSFLIEGRGRLRAFAGRYRAPQPSRDRLLLLERVGKHLRAALDEILASRLVGTAGCEPATPTPSAPPTVDQPSLQAPTRTGTTKMREEGLGEIRLLGQCLVEGPAGLVLGEARRDAWALLGLLAEHRNLPLRRETAYAKLWPDVDPAGDRDIFWKPMREARARLVEALGGEGPTGTQVIQKLGRSSYRVNQGFFTFDVWRLHDALDAARAAAAPDKAEALTRVVECYTGSFLSGCDHMFARSAARALDQKVVDVLTQLADLSEPELAALYLERATSIDPTAEHLYWQRMETYARLGRRAAIHHCYQELGQVLDDVGLRYPPKTIEVYRRLSCI